MCALTTSAYGRTLLLLPSVNSEQHAIQAQQDIETILVKQLNKKLHNVQVASKIDSICSDQPCDSDIQVLSRLISRYPLVDLVLFYSVPLSENKTAFITAYDPYSQTEIFNIVLESDQVANWQTNVIASALGQQATINIENLQHSVQIELALKGFSVEELVPVTTFLLSLSQENQVKLIKTLNQNYALSSIMPVVETHYSVYSDMTVTHLYNELVRFWELQNIDVDMSFEREDARLTISRIGNPYTPSMVTLGLVAIVGLVLIYLSLHRYFFHNRLEYLAEKKYVEEWLATYKKASKNIFKVSDHWKSQLNFWQQINRESQQLEKQAKIFYDAGDLHTAKLFISKALNINASAPLANKLIREIEKEESSSKQLTDREQWVRNKIAKAMSNFRNDSIYKALRQAYQAESSIREDKHFKKQLKAITKLINRINGQASYQYSRLHIRHNNLPEQISLGCEEKLMIGRENDTLTKDFVGVVAIEHKGLSRIGRQTLIYRDEKGFWLEDLGSTNGTYVNGKKLESSYCIQDTDKLLFGADSQIAGVVLNVQLYNQADALHLSLEKNMHENQGIRELAQLWPDYMHAARMEYWVTKIPLVLCMDKDSKALSLSTERKKYGNNVAICRIELLPYASVAPIGDANVNVEGQPLLGKMPVILPMQLEFDGEIITLTADSYTQIKQSSHFQHQTRLMQED